MAARTRRLTAAYQRKSHEQSCFSILRCEDTSEIQTDASSTGLGACLLQEGRLVAYAFRTLIGIRTNRERNARHNIHVPQVSGLHVRESGNRGARPQATRDNHAKTPQRSPTQAPTDASADTTISARRSTRSQKGSTGGGCIVKSPSSDTAACRTHPCKT